MKISLETLNTAAFTLGKRLQGYKLLKNPKGSSPYEVNMMKSSFGLHCKYSDDMFTYRRIQRKKIDGKTVVTRKYLFSTHFFDPETKQITNKKDIWYSEFKNGKFVGSKTREDIPYKEQNKRPVPKWEKHEELIYARERFAEENLKDFYQPHISLFENIMTCGLAKTMRQDSRPMAQGFFKTLAANLKGGK